MATRSPAARRAPAQRRSPLAPVDGFSRALARGLRATASEATASFSWGDVDGWLVATVAALCAFGLVMVYSASEALGYSWYGDAGYFFHKQAEYMVVGAIGFLVLMRLDYHRWRAWAPRAMVVAFVLLVLVLVPHLGSERLGARRWFGIGSLSVQPSALATLVAILYGSRWLADRAPVVETWKVARDFTVLLSVVLGLIVLEKDLGSAIVLAGAGLTLLLLGGARLRWIGAVVTFLGAMGWVAIKLETYRANRLACFRDPFQDPLNCGFQSVQSLYALGSGGLRGVGLGNSVQKYQWLPEAHTDFIFAIIGEELGLIGTLAVIGAFLLLIWRGVAACRRAPDLFGGLLAGGITAWIGVQAFVNMAAVTGVSPTTGITLPFISSGGSSLITTLLATGVLCNISAQGRRQGEARRAHVDRWGRDGRASHTGPRSGRRTAVDGVTG